QLGDINTAIAETPAIKAQLVDQAANNATIAERLDKLEAQGVASSAEGQFLAKLELLETHQCKIWVSGFVSPMLGSMLEEHGKHLLGLLPSHHTAGATIRGYNLNKSYSIKFANEKAAAAFVDHCRSAGMQYQDQATNSTVNLRVRFDAPAGIRVRSKYLGRLWQAIAEAMKRDGKWKADYSIGSNGFKGILYMRVGECLFVLFELISTDRNQFECKAFPDNLSKFGIDSDAATAMVATSME
ncbi:unnamed protein product, partial [Prorocentrum cordatum]